ncbi:MAG: hypothetical protein KDB82_03720 [Planctomycetes bacterium]|nr:hypothetical protein [Planctomycetota bacterium]
MSAMLAPLVFGVLVAPVGAIMLNAGLSTELSVSLVMLAALCVLMCSVVHLLSRLNSDDHAWTGGLPPKSTRPRLGQQPNVPYGRRVWR